MQLIETYFLLWNTCQLFLLIVVLNLLVKLPIFIRGKKLVECVGAVCRTCLLKVEADKKLNITNIVPLLSQQKLGVLICQVSAEIVLWSK